MQLTYTNPPAHLFIGDPLDRDKVRISEYESFKLQYTLKNTRIHWSISKGNVLYGEGYVNTKDFDDPWATCEARAMNMVDAYKVLDSEMEPKQSFSSLGKVTQGKLRLGSHDTMKEQSH
jgi:hypothetical protein